MCLRFVDLLITRLCAAAGLSRRAAAWRNAEILLLHHQLSVAQRRLGGHTRPRVSRADRALMALLLGLIPKVKHPGLRLIVIPGTILRWRREILRRRWAAKSQPKGRPATRRSTFCDAQGDKIGTFVYATPDTQLAGQLPTVTETVRTGARVRSRRSSRGMSYWAVEEVFGDAAPASR